MKEYIEKAAVEKFIEDGLNNPDKNKAFGHDAIEIMAEVHYMQAADVVEVRHGRWLPEACESVSKRNRLIEYRVYSCSICGRSIGRVKKRYCPNCGALMDRKEDEHEAT